jgi:DNA-binding transcriptional ArsR family regulator
VLREAGLVRARGEGQRRLYSVDPAPLDEVDAWLASWRGFWAQRLDALDTELRRTR